ncbi:nuclease-related domain-containing protein [Bacillus niameyensis]|uniref:nuclease-related domain-containing protein n=1 Tax=Bacillus niameyensis TaxID=1522308 RepID=UPI000782D933|nr:nuclease-related domain-containing protein [Bacillus niameyensis]
MAFKPYHESAVLQILRCLNPRMEFSSEDQQQYFNLEKGHEGEQRFATMLDSLTNDWIILYDLLLESDNSIFQIDALLISQHTIYLFDPKNNEGEYYIESDNWYTRAGKEIKNPVHQLNRSVLLLERLLQKYGFTLPLKVP